MLVAFDAIEQERNITVAASRIGISQPAMSNALARLRRTFNDPLFVRTSHGMEPTPFAKKLSRPIRRSCSLINDALRTAGNFDAASSRRKFVFYMSDIGEAVNLPIIVQHLRKVARDISVKVSRIPPRDAHEAMMAGDVDIALGLFPNLMGGFFEQRLYCDTFVCIVRADHPEIGGVLTRKQFVEALHGVVSFTGTGHDAAVEKTLARQRIKRRIGLLVQHFATLPIIISRTDLIATIPLKAAQSFSNLIRIKMLRPPIKIPSFDIKQHWHERFHHDPGNRWMRQQIATLFLDTRAPRPVD
ncbi:MAG: LysR family transcriptional regulator [Stellaceae bacterium]